MDHNKDLYNILKLDRNCTIKDIKKSYKKFALIYHPDKCSLPDAKDKYIDIQNAYQILNNPLERKKYDSLNNSQKMEFYDSLKTYIKTKIPNIDDYIKLFFDDETSLKKHVYNMDLISIYSKILERFPNIDFPDTLPRGRNLRKSGLNESDLNECGLHESSLYEGDLNERSLHEGNLQGSYTMPLDINIYGKLSATLEERYLDKYREIQVNRLTKYTNIYCIPLRESRVIIEGEGEYDRFNEIHGDIIINIEVVDTYNDFVQIKNDIYCTRYISLHSYLYGGEFELKYIDNSVLNIKFDSFVENFPLLTIEGKGMLVCDSIYFMENSTINENINRGNLYVTIKIINLESLFEDIKKICD